MCGAQTGSQPSAASKGLVQGWVSLTGKQTQTLFNVTARMCSTFPDELFGILAWLETLLVPLRSAQLGQGSPARATPAMPACPCPCPSPGERSGLRQGQGPTADGAGQSPSAPGSWRDAQMEPNGTCDLTALSVVLCCRSCPKTQHSSPFGAALG